MVQRLLILITVLFTFSTITCKAQDGGLEVFTDTHGMPFTKKSFEDISGNPYLIDKWVPGTAQAASGLRFDNLKLKYDTYDNQLIFVYNDNDEPLMFKDNIKSFTLLSPLPLHFSKGFPAIDNQITDSYYQVLSNGRLTLLKHYGKVITQHKEYGNDATMFKSFQDITDYYLYTGHKMIKVKRSKSDILALMTDKSADVNAFIGRNKISFKSDDDLAALFDYYNKL